MKTFLMTASLAIAFACPSLAGESPAASPAVYPGLEQQRAPHYKIVPDRVAAAIRLAKSKENVGFTPASAPRPQFNQPLPSRGFSR